MTTVVPPGGTSPQSRQAPQTQIRRSSHEDALERCASFVESDPMHARIGSALSGAFPSRSFMVMTVLDVYNDSGSGVGRAMQTTSAHRANESAVEAAKHSGDSAWDLLKSTFSLNPFTAIKARLGLLGKASPAAIGARRQATRDQETHERVNTAYDEKIWGALPDDARQALTQATAGMPEAQRKHALSSYVDAIGKSVRDAGMDPRGVGKMVLEHYQRQRR